MRRLTQIVWRLLMLDTPAPETPWTKTAPKTTQRQHQDKPANLVHYAGRAFVQKEDTENRVFEDTLYQGGGQRTGEVGQADLEVIRLYRLDETKYRELKPLWAGGMSAAKAARKYEGKRGYSVRTLDDYWRVFSAVAAPPLPAR